MIEIPCWEVILDVFKSQTIEQHHKTVKTTVTCFPCFTFTWTWTSARIIYEIHWRCIEGFFCYCCCYLKRPNLGSSTKKRCRIWHSLCTNRNRCCPQFSLLFLLYSINTRYCQTQCWWPVGCRVIIAFNEASMNFWTNCNVTMCSIIV